MMDLAITRRNRNYGSRSLPTPTVIQLMLMAEAALPGPELSLKMGASPAAFSCSPAGWLRPFGITGASR
jgi:hypothetical protein